MTNQARACSPCGKGKYSLSRIVIPLDKHFYFHEFPAENTYNCSYLAGSSTPNKINVGSITKAQLEEIANIKLPDLNTNKINSAMKIVEGTARNMGISIVD